MIVTSCAGCVCAGYSTIRSAYFLDWHEVDLSTVARTFLAMPVIGTNDVESLLEAENWFGVGREAASYAVITTGSGSAAASSSTTVW